MADIPKLKNWRAFLENRLEKSTNNENDILRILYLCQDYLIEIQPASQWLAQQQGFINQIQRLYNDIYFTRFNTQPPPRPTGAPVPEVLLDTPERRKQSIREVALAITEPGDYITDKVILEELKRRGMKIDAPNPTATISTILNGFKLHFEKMPGKRGVFQRKMATS